MFFYNTAGFLLVHPLLLNYYKYLGMQKALTIQGEKSIELIVLKKDDVLSHKSDYFKIHSREFRLNGNLYDIVSEIHSGSLIYLYCINDMEEEELEKEFKKKTESNATDKTQLPVNYSQLYPLISEAVCYLSFNQTDVIRWDINLYNKSIYAQYWSDIPTPPPRPLSSI